MQTPCCVNLQIFTQQNIYNHSTCIRETELTYIDDWRGEQSPGKELQEDDNQGVVHTGLPLTGDLQQNTGFSFHS